VSNVSLDKALELWKRSAKPEIDKNAMTNNLQRQVLYHGILHKRKHTPNVIGVFSCACHRVFELDRRGNNKETDKKRLNVLAGAS